MEGTHSFQSTGASSVSFARKFAPLDTKLDTIEGAVMAWLYVSDTSLLGTDGQLEITSSGTFDTDEYSWDLTSLQLVNGWNHLNLRMKNADKIGNPDLSAINFFRLYHTMTGSNTLRLDYVRIYGHHPYGIGLDNCDQTTGWTGAATVSRDYFEKLEGHASLTTTGSGPQHLARTWNDAVNCGLGYSGGHLTFQLYVQDISLFNGAGTFTLANDGAAKNQAYSWTVSSANLQNGWNDVVLKFTDATLIGSPNTKDVTYFEFNQPVSAAQTFRIDNMGMTRWPDSLYLDEPDSCRSVDPSTLQGKILFGYQGWFAHPGEGSTLNRWRHWFKGQSPDATKASFDMWPDFTEYPDSELYKTNMTYPSGDTALLYSSYLKPTIERHFKWMQEHKLDGVIEQRFINGIRNAPRLEWEDHVLQNVQSGAEKYGRVFGMMYDISGYDPTKNGGKTVATFISENWIHLVDSIGITNSSAYLHHDGKPVLGLWGFGFTHTFGTAFELDTLLDWFHTNADPKYQATIIGGLNNDWRFHNASWRAAYDKLDVISPWAVGRYNNDAGNANFVSNTIVPDKDYCDDEQIHYMPVIWPGFSWYNLKIQAGSSAPLNSIPRNGGQFYWKSASRTINSGVQMIYVAMFDEVDEGTAMFKLAPTSNEIPSQGMWVALDIDGFSLPSDWYLRMATETGRIIRGEKSNQFGIIGNPEPAGSNCTSSKRGAKEAIREQLASEIETSSPLDLSIVPNPAQANEGFHAMIYSPEGGPVQLQVIDLNGKLVKDASLELMPGMNQMGIWLEGTPAGMYFLQAIQGKERVVKRLILNR